MMDTDIKINSGDSVRDELTNGDFQRLAEAWVEHQLGPLREQTLGERTRERIGLNSGHKTDRIQRQAFQQRVEDDLQESAHSGNMAIAKKDELVIGMVRVQPITHVGEHSPIENGEIYELDKAYVNPKERRQGVYNRLRAELIRRMQAEHPNAIILSGTHNEMVKKNNRTEGWEEIGFDGYLRVHGYPEEVIEREIDEYKNNGWTAFIKMPDV